jgi:hypothetical protein
MLARQIHRTDVKPERAAIGGFAHSMKGKGDNNEMFYSGPEKWVNDLQDFFSFQNKRVF